MTIQKRNFKANDSLEHEDTDTLLDKGPIKKILNWHEIPAWMQDNAYITGGYRPPSNSYKQCIQSLFYLHNESVNIWSHLLGFILFAGLGVYFVWSKPYVDTLTRFDITYFFIFIAGALTCLGFSASYHCFSCHSEKVSLTWNRCDYAGITSLTVGSFFPVIYYGFHCHQLFQILYLSIIVVLGLVTATVTLAQHFRTPAYRWIRATLFISLGLFGVVPTLHGIYIYGLNNATKTISLAHLVLMAVTYIFGALLYGARFPERMRPGAFNYFGASHQIFHLCVVIALISHYLGVMSAMAFWHNPINVEFCTGYI